MDDLINDFFFLFLNFSKELYHMTYEMEEPPTFVTVSYGG